MAFEYFKMAYSRWQDFSGRSRRSEYWYFNLFYAISIVALSFLEGILWEMPILTVLWLIISFVPSLAVTIRRLHDTSHSGWWLLIGLIPIVGSIVLLVFYCTDSTPGTNKWGPNPKEVGSEDVTDHLIED